MHIACGERLVFVSSSFYMVVATEDNTDVQVMYAHDTVEEYFTLDKYEVFTRDTYHVSGRPVTDFTGTQVLSSKPVAVFSGVAVAKLHAPVSSLD